MGRKSAVVILGVASAFAASFAGTTASASATAVPFSISTVPALSPTFSAAVSDYAVACPDHAKTRVSTTGSATTVIGGKQFPGRTNVRVPLVPGQSLKITGGGRSYFIRCLASDFPAYVSTVKGKPQTTGLLVTPSLSFNASAGNYIVVFDPHGVPVWWYRDANVPIDAKFFGASTIGWASGSSSARGGIFEFRGLDGSLQHTVGSASLVMDEHDIQRLPNGNYLGIIYVPRDGVDLSRWGLSAQSRITDNVIIEVNAKNEIVWSWSVADHIDVEAENVKWRDQSPDVIHMNSIQYFGNHEIIFSARHLDAVYDIDKPSGAVLWKLGGTPTAQSLTAVHDPYAGVNPPGLFSGQHDARIVAGGNLTLQDNGTRQARAIRALRFSIDTRSRTATELEQLTDARSNGPGLCCGGVDRLAGNWLASWGAATYVTELTPRGVPVLTISYSPYFSYRVAPVPATIAALRHGMDARVPPLRL
jgi:hypothetical protein